MPIAELSQAKMNAKYGFFRSEWPERARGFTQVRDGIEEVHAVVTEFVALNNRNEASGDVTRQGVARRNAPAAQRFLNRLSTVLDRAERETETAQIGKDREAEEGAGDDPTAGAFANEMRARVFEMGQSRRFNFLRERMQAKDVAVFKAIASAPPWLSGLSDNEHDTLMRLFRAASDPEVEASKHALNLAINELKRAVKNAEGLIRSNTDFSTPFGGEQGPASPDHVSPVQRVA